ncbi:hypothetical protein [Moorena sp. SIO3H5]|uniref:hypothetical protein n=1 Tax=Moorena sp. SIO3H5 TaxID=2607834 RepID=UPI0013BC5996|nr:hypothetical protein [Moorena sp. SIO3H5]NEO68813.1 hypothetical protein [Moorena sp. SIO3H5]
MFINYFSGSRMALAVDLPDNTALQSRLSKKLKAMLGKNFTVLQSKYRMESGGLTDLFLWTISDALTFWEYWAFVSKSKLLNLLSKNLSSISTRQQCRSCHLYCVRLTSYHDLIDITALLVSAA